METLTTSDWDFILESLKYTKMKFDDYKQYPSQEYKQKIIDEAAFVMQKVQQVRKGIKTLN